MSAITPFSLRPAELRDVDPIVELIRELAEFEKLEHLMQATPEKLRPQLFGEKAGRRGAGGGGARRRQWRA